MANLVLTQEQLEDLFANSGQAITGFKSENVRIAYSEKGQPGYSIRDNVLFVYVARQNDPYDRKQDKYYTPINGNPTNCLRTVKYTRVYKVLWTFYGRAANEKADELCHGLLLPENNEALQLNGVGIITDIVTPRTTRELFNGQWWNRVDVETMYNVRTVRENEEPYIIAADIEIHDDHGLQRTIEVDTTE